MDKSTSISEVIKDEPALVKSVSDNLDLLRPSSRYFSIFKGRGKDGAEYGKTKYTLIKDVEEYQPGIYDKPLPCFGCGVGWFSDPRERAGLAASAIAALGCSLLLFIILLIRLV